MTLEIFTNKKTESAQAAISELSNISDNIIDLIQLIVGDNNNNNPGNDRKIRNLQVKIMDSFRYVFADINESQIIPNRILRLSAAVKNGWDGRGI